MVSAVPGSGTGHGGADPPPKASTLPLPAVAPGVLCAPPVPPPAPWVYRALCPLSWLHLGVYKACSPAVPSQSGSSSSSSFDTPPASMPASPASPTAASPTYTPGVCELWPQAALLPETPPCMPWGLQGSFSLYALLAELPLPSCTTQISAGIPRCVQLLGGSVLWPF